MTKEEFKKMFSNIPLAERSNPIYVDKEYGSMSWNVVNIEVDNDTPVGLRALKFMNFI